MTFKNLKEDFNYFMSDSCSYADRFKDFGKGALAYILVSLPVTYITGIPLLGWGAGTYAYYKTIDYLVHHEITIAERNRRQNLNMIKE